MGKGSFLSWMKGESLPEFTVTKRTVLQSLLIEISRSSWETWGGGGGGRGGDLLEMTKRKTRTSQRMEGIAQEMEFTYTCQLSIKRH